MLAGARPQIEDAIGLDHDLRVVLDHQQRVAGIAQPLHDADHALHVTRVQADRGLIEHEQRIDQRGPERGGQVDALDLAARERARLAIERQIAQPTSHRNSAACAARRAADPRPDRAVRAATAARRTRGSARSTAA
jgi:hypothetical protein